MNVIGKSPAVQLAVCWTKVNGESGAARLEVGMALMLQPLGTIADAGLETTAAI